ncbi:AEL_collapsed_G0032310.mRNA.1.CDS.1 [Saccharomyces cerevisiae]|nr:AEL_collapsed_G0032310.mRNA.1.CDS.1 [Saccharomyces cerevisiae]
MLVLPRKHILTTNGSTLRSSKLMIFLPEQLSRAQPYWLTINQKAAKTLSKSGYELDIDPILLSIFSHRFMDIALQMGTQLRKTSVSTNVKERLDFSCALFDSKRKLSG